MGLRVRLCNRQPQYVSWWSPLMDGVIRILNEAFIHAYTSYLSSILFAVNIIIKKRQQQLSSCIAYIRVIKTQKHHTYTRALRFIYTHLFQKELTSNVSVQLNLPDVVFSKYCACVADAVVSCFFVVKERKQLGCVLCVRHFTYDPSYALCFHFFFLKSNNTQTKYSLIY